MAFTAKQLDAISITERVCSAVSLSGTSIIVVSFLSSRAFRKPINRLVFYACWGNVMANIATVVSQSGINAGIGSPLCQFQAFLIQWFMPADALWTLAMAFNVYLTFFRKYNSDQLRQQEWKYLIVCYGLPFIPAFTYFFVKSGSRGRIYGSAVLWCWVTSSWDFLRIALFYGPVWFVIFVTLAIYARTGRVIYRKRRELQQLSNHESAIDLESPDEPVFSKVTDIQITRERSHAACDIACPDRAALHPISPRDILSPYDPYSVHVEGGPSSEQSNSISVEPGRHEYRDSFNHRPSVASDTGANRAAWAYTKYAMLFFIALIITWVPSTINRVYALAYPDRFNFPLNYLSSFVLPLQGFWNSLIYVSISWPAFKSTLNGLRRSGTCCCCQYHYAALSPEFRRPSYDSVTTQRQPLVN